MVAHSPASVSLHVQVVDGKVSSLPAGLNILVESGGLTILVEPGRLNTLVESMGLGTPPHELRLLGICTCAAVHAPQMSLFKYQMINIT